MEEVGSELWQCLIFPGDLPPVLGPRLELGSHRPDVWQEDRLQLGTALWHTCALGHRAQAECAYSLSQLPAMLFSCRILLLFSAICLLSRGACLQAWEIPELFFHLHFHPSHSSRWATPYPGSSFKQE